MSADPPSMAAVEMRDTVLNVDWPQRWFITVAGTSYTLLDAHKPDHRRWLGRAAVRLLWAMGTRPCEIAEPSRSSKPPAQWRHHALIRPATPVDVDAVTRPLISETTA